MRNSITVLYEYMCTTYPRQYNYVVPTYIVDYGRYRHRRMYYIGTTDL